MCFIDLTVDDVTVVNIVRLVDFVALFECFLLSLNFLPSMAKTVFFVNSIFADVLYV